MHDEQHEPDRIPAQLPGTPARHGRGAVRAVPDRRRAFAKSRGPFLALIVGDFLDGATMHATELHRQICSAITRRSLVMFEYGDLIRVVEPHRFGINSAGHPMLSGWLRAGYSRSDPSGGWRNYLLDEITAFQLLDAPFAGTRPGYAAHDQRMREVFCELTPTAVDVAAEGPYIVREPMPSESVIPTPTEAGSRDDRTTAERQPGDNEGAAPDRHP